MTEFAGLELRVGEIRALRTFRIGPVGQLLPLFGDGPWRDGPNVADCTAVVPDGVAHVGGVPEPECRCGFYAYANKDVAGQYAQSRYVLAVVICWGRVIAGTRGLRCQYAAVEALWLADRVPEPLARQVAANYPSARLYPTTAQMLASHPPDRLECYESRLPTGAIRGVSRVANSAGLLALGALPAQWLSLPVHWVMLAMLALAMLLSTPGTISRRGAGNPRQRLLGAGLALWAAAPLLGLAGAVFLQAPLILMFALVMGHVLDQRRHARRFPAASS